jgi:hypothetical protein
MQLRADTRLTAGTFFFRVPARRMLYEQLSFATLTEPQACAV